MAETRTQAPHPAPEMDYIETEENRAAAADIAGQG